MIKLKVYKKTKDDGKITFYAPITNEFNGKRTTYYLLINFKKGTEIESDSALIEVKDFFLSSYWVGEAKLKMIITDYDIVEKNKEVLADYNSEKEKYADFGEIEIDDSQIAF